MVRMVRSVRITAIAFAIAASTLTSPAIFAAESKSKPSAKETYKTASQLFQAEEFEAALPFFQRAYELSNGRPVTVVGLAQCERALKQYAAAIKHFEEYLASGPPKAKAQKIKETLKLTRTLQTNSGRAQTKQTRDTSQGKLRELPKAISRTGTSSTALANTAVVPEKALVTKVWFWVSIATVVALGGLGGAYLAQDDQAPDGGSSGVLLGR